MHLLHLSDAAKVAQRGQPRLFRPETACHVVIDRFGQMCGNLVVEVTVGLALRLFGNLEEAVDDSGCPVPPRFLLFQLLAACPGQ